MSVGNVSPYLSTPTGAAPKAPSSDLTKDDFLKLLTVQLQQQDPLNPEDPTQFTSQLTQYSSLEQLMGVNTNLTGLSSQQSADSRLAAASYIGKMATVNGDMVSVTKGTASTLHYTASSDATATSVKIYDQSGTLIKTVALGPQKAGTHDFQWDATKDAGSKFADGNYRFEVSAQGSDGKDIAVDSSFSGLVTGVRFDNGQTALQIGGLSWPTDSVTGIDNPS